MPTAEILPTQAIDPENPLPRIYDVLAAYVGRTGGTNTTSATVFKCPADEKSRFPAEGSSYEWNAELNGHRINETRTDTVNGRNKLKHFAAVKGLTVIKSK